MNVIIFGGAGFIGANVTKHLYLLGHNITIYDRDIHLKNIPDCNISVIEGDFFLEDNFEELLINQDVIIHLISSVSPASSIENNLNAYRNDIIKTIELCEVAKKVGIEKIIFLSSGGTVYGQTAESCITENSQTQPINHYGIIKLSIEKILLMYNTVYNMQNIILRVANPYGEWQNPQKRIGAISVFIDSILGNKPITLFGDGLIIRDYVEISDVCHSVSQAMNYKNNREIEPVFNIGTGLGMSLIDIINLIEVVTKIKAEVIYKPVRNIDVTHNVLDISKAKKILGYNPQIDIRSGIKNMIELSMKNA